MPTYLLTWNPNRWEWTDIQDAIADIEKTGWHAGGWSSGRNKRIARGDRVFLLRQGRPPKGICASGWADSDCFEDTHWDEALAEQSKQAIYVNVNFNVILDPDLEPLLPRNELEDGILSQVHWDTQVSGIAIHDDIAQEVEKRWSAFLARHPRMSRFSIEDDALRIPGEVDEKDTYTEGSVKQISVNIYERNSEARRKCLDFYGLNCFVCGFNFESIYGNLGRNYIHVHHIKPLSEISAEYELNPHEDLRPVCPNCHAMIHRVKRPLSIDELKKRIKKQHFT